MKIVKVSILLCVSVVGLQAMHSSQRPKAPARRAFRQDDFEVAYQLDKPLREKPTRVSRYSVDLGRPVSPTRKHREFIGRGRSYLSGIARAVAKERAIMPETVADSEDRSHVSASCSDISEEHEVAKKEPCLLVQSILGKHSLSSSDFSTVQRVEHRAAPRAVKKEASFLEKLRKDSEIMLPPVESILTKPQQRKQAAREKIHMPSYEQLMRNIQGKGFDALLKKTDLLEDLAGGSFYPIKLDTMINIAMNSYVGFLRRTKGVAEAEKAKRQLNEKKPQLVEALLVSVRGGLFLMEQFGLYRPSTAIMH